MKIIRRVFVPVLVLSLAAGAYALETTLIGAPDIVPPATDEMQHPEFWISRLDGDPETVIMTSEQINAFNQKNRTRKLEWNDINGKPASIEDERNHEIYNGLMYYLEDPLTLTAVPVERLRDDFKRLHKYLTGMTLWDRRQIPYPDEKKMAIIDAINASALPAAAKPRYGLIGLSRTVLPTAH